jgi:hypothetical protein
MISAVISLLHGFEHVLVLPSRDARAPRELPQMSRVVVAIDPSGTRGPGRASAPHQFASTDGDEAFDFHAGPSPAYFDRNLRLVCLGKIFVDPQFPAARSWRHLAKPAMQISRTFIRIEPSNLRR